MNQSLNISNRNIIRNLIFILSSAVLSVGMIYTDEGAYSLNLFDLSTWIAIACFSGKIFICQYFVFRIVLKKYEKMGKILLSTIGGVILFILLMFVCTGLFIMIKQII
jgi:hypothetical protein